MSSTTTSVTSGIAHRIKEEIRNLNLENSPDVNVRKRMWADSGTGDLKPLHMGVTIVPVGFTGYGGTNEREGKAYTYEVTLRRGHGSELVDSDWVLPRWYELIHKRFQGRRIEDLNLSVCELYCTCKAGKLPEKAKLNDGEDVSVLVVRCIVREARDT